MLHSRLRPRPRRHPATTSAPAPDLKDEDQNNEIEESPEDLFGAFLPHLFPDDAPSFHGDPGQHLLYSSPRYGDLEIMVPSYPSQCEKRTEEIAAGLEKKDGVNKVEEGRKLFAHFLWSAALVVAEGVEDADCPQAGPETEARKEAREIWSVKGEGVLELGAGEFCLSYHLFHPPPNQTKSAGLTYHPKQAPPSPPSSAPSPTHPPSPQPTTPPHLRFQAQSPSTWTTTSAARPQRQKFPSTHTNGERSTTHSPSKEKASSPASSQRTVSGCARNTRTSLARCSGSSPQTGKCGLWLAFIRGGLLWPGFFETALNNGFEIERIFERDLISKTMDGQEVRREWVPVREGEGPENRRRWCVVAVLTRRE